MSKTFEDITPEQEYYIGRAVAAVILDKYEPYTDEKALEYINLLGQTLALFSDRPETFGGYHFMILDSDEIKSDAQGEKASAIQQQSYSAFIRTL